MNAGGIEPVDGGGEEVARPDEDLDLTADEPIDAAESGLTPPPTEPYSIVKKREDMRGIIALSLVGLLAVVIVGAFGTLWTAGTLDEGIKDLLTLVLGPVVTLVGSVTGYYFGGRVSPAKDQESE